MKIKVRNGNNVLVVLVGVEDITPLNEILDHQTIVQIYDFDWDEMLSPWPHERIFKKGNDFQGKADQFLEKFMKEDIFQKEYRRKMIIGYSLAGLFSLYACMKTDYFTDCASVSGSLWYPDFLTYILNHPVHCQNVYVSLGQQEKNTKNLIMSQVEEKTNEIVQILNKTIMYSSK